MSLTMRDPSLDDNVDFENAAKGFVGTLEPCIVMSKDGHVVWNSEEYTFLQDDCPPTVNPRLWRQSKLCFTHGLFEVTTGIYQVRGLDISNMTVIEGETGIIVLDTLLSVECADAALGLYRKHRGNRPVKAVLISHSHVDHFAGTIGVLPHSQDGKYDTPIVAPEGFMVEALGENVFVGPIMRKRAVSMYGGSLSKGPKGHVGCGLGLAASQGTTSLIPPTDIIRHTGEERTIDGVRIVFQMVPETEAPSEMNFFFPDHRALCISECATHNMHNIITLRGALVRDAKAWSKYLDETIVLYGDRSDVLFSSHHWPTWDSRNLVRLISEQRDLYGYLHDQTVRLMNRGLNGAEIAEQMTLPPALAQAWHLHGFYGSVSHNVKGIYQRYMTWFDGNPANLWKHTPAAEGHRYVDCMGGVDAVIGKAKQYAAGGDLRFAATLLDHAVAAEPNNQGARMQIAEVYEMLGIGAENATWRNFYLTGAQEMRKFSDRKPSQASARQPMRRLSTFNPQASIDNWLDALSVQLDGPRACATPLASAIRINVPEQKMYWVIRLSNGTMSHRSEPVSEHSRDRSDVDLVVTLGKTELHRVLEGGEIPNVENSSKGDTGALLRLLDLCGIKPSLACTNGLPSKI